MTKEQKKCKPSANNILKIKTNNYVHCIDCLIFSHIDIVRCFVAYFLENGYTLLCNYKNIIEFTQLKTKQFSFKRSNQILDSKLSLTCIYIEKTIGYFRSVNDNTDMDERCVQQWKSSSASATKVFLFGRLHSPFLFKNNLTYSEMVYNNFTNKNNKVRHFQ